MPVDRPEPRSASNEVRTAMNDLALALVTLGFFAVAILLVRALDRF
jgi:hypothetical protein